jgi:hypothetical protein
MPTDTLPPEPSTLEKKITSSRANVQCRVSSRCSSRHAIPGIDCRNISSSATRGCSNGNGVVSVIRGNRAIGARHQINITAVIADAIRTGHNIGRNFSRGNGIIRNFGCGDAAIRQA